MAVTLYALKPRFQTLLRPFVTWLATVGVTANQVTLVAAFGSLVIGALVAAAAPIRWPFLVLPLWFFVRMALNAIDGMLAREFNQRSKLGAYLNEIFDVVSDAALYAPFGWLPVFGPFAVAVVIFLALLSELAGVLGPSIGASRRYDGPLGKSDRAFVFGALAVWIGTGGPLPGWSVGIMIVVQVLLALTIANRVRGGISESRGMP